MRHAEHEETLLKWEEKKWPQKKMKKGPHEILWIGNSKKPRQQPRSSPTIGPWVGRKWPSWWGGGGPIGFFWAWPGPRGRPRARRGGQNRPIPGKLGPQNPKIPAPREAASSGGPAARGLARAWGKKWGTFLGRGLPASRSTKPPTFYKEASCSRLSFPFSFSRLKENQELG